MPARARRSRCHPSRSSAPSECSAYASIKRARNPSAIAAIEISVYVGRPSRPTLSAGARALFAGMREGDRVRRRGKGRTARAPPRGSGPRRAVSGVASDRRTAKPPEGRREPTGHPKGRPAAKRDGQEAVTPCGNVRGTRGCKTSCKTSCKTVPRKTAK
jgi:hypothetical protein